MSQGNDQEKTEQATPKRLQNAREKGNVAQSKEVTSSLVLLASLGVLFFSGPWMFQSILMLMREGLQQIGTVHHLQNSSVQGLMFSIFEHIFRILFPLMLAVVIAGIAGNIIQIGFLFTLKPFSPDLSKFDPIKGMKKFLSLKSLVELVKSLIKIAFVAGISFLMVKDELAKIPLLMRMGIGEIFSFIGTVSFRICLYTCLALIILAILDYTYQRWQYQKNLMMSKQEIKDELKQGEGDPAVKGRIKSIQRETARKRMMEKIPDADVVITNPTSLAIALRYNMAHDSAPRVIAKGAGFIAEKIKKIAQQNGIPIVENKPLARTIYKLVDIDGFIPFNLYRAVAEILAYVYKLKGMKGQINRNNT